MHYFQFNIADYRSATVHLSNEEDLAYRRLLDMYYDMETKIPLDTQWVARRIRMDAEVIKCVLVDMFEQHEDGWFHARCQETIEHYHAMAEKNRANGKLGGRRKNPVGSDSQPNAKATNNYKPETNNQKPIVERSQRGLRLANDWILPDDWEYWANKERPDLNAKQVAEQFRDFWCAKPGKDGVKLDWQATWRNWVRNQKSPKQNPADIVRTTVPMSNKPDEALEKIKADDLKRAPIPLSVLAKMAELRKAKA
jgi:uncharacterized protein YdaU (DUF1376 family)